MAPVYNAWWRLSCSFWLIWHLTGSFLADCCHFINCTFQHAAQTEDFFQFLSLFSIVLSGAQILIPKRGLLRRQLTPSHNTISSNTVYCYCNGLLFCCKLLFLFQRSLFRTVSCNSFSATWQYYSLVDLAEVAEVLWQQEYPCGQSVGSEAKPVRNNVLGNGSLILFHPRGKPFMFQLDTHGWTEVRGTADLVCVCLASGGWSYVRMCVGGVKADLVRLLLPLPRTQALHDVVRWGHSWQKRDSNDPQCSPLNQEVPIKPGEDHWQ